MEQIEEFIRSSHLIEMLDDVRTEYDTHLQQPGRTKFKDVSNEGTLMGCFTEVMEGMYIGNSLYQLGL